MTTDVVAAVLTSVAAAGAAFEDAEMIYCDGDSGEETTLLSLLLSFYAVPLYMPLFMLLYFFPPW